MKPGSQFKQLVSGSSDVRYLPAAHFLHDEPSFHVPAGQTHSLVHSVISTSAMGKITAASFFGMRRQIVDLVQ
jgi:hypothetical protein